MVFIATRNARWKPNWAVPTLLLFFSIAVSNSSAITSFEDPWNLEIEFAGESQVENSRTIWPGSKGAGLQIGRSLLQVQSKNTGENNKNETYILRDPKNRIDPLNHFKRYKGGYNIKSKHYWASTVFTGIYGYAIAAAWIIAGVLYGLFLIVKSCCCNKNRKKSVYEPHSSRYYVWPFLLVLLLTIVAIITSALVLTGNTRFHTKAKRVEKTIVGAAENATNTIYNVTTAMKIMQEQLKPYNEEAYERLNSTAERLDMEASNIHDRVFDNKHTIDLGLRILHIAAAVIVSFNLVLVLFAVVVLLLHWRQVFFILIFICWLLTALCWLAFGVYFVIHTFADDTCIELKEYQRNPHNTTLNSILPCVDLEAADDTLAEARAGVHDFIIELNRNISMLQTSGLSSLKNIPYICDPFSGAPNYEYIPNECSNGTIEIGDIPRVLEMFKCSKNDTGECLKRGKFLPQSIFNQAEAYSTSIQNLLDIFPALQSLTNCSFVKDTFSTILNEQCSPIKSTIHMVWTSLVALSTAMVFLVITWIAKAYQNGGRQFLKGSVIPQDTSSPTDTPKQQNHTTILHMKDIH